MDPRRRGDDGIGICSDHKRGGYTPADGWDMVAAAMHAGTRRQEAALEWRDGIVGAALFAGTLLYLARWPYNLGSSDEGIYLYQSKRLLDGEVFFRDIFDIIPPGAHYLMAAAYWLFGTTMTTARAVNALMHAAMMVGLYAGARLVGTSIALSVLPPLAHLALCQAAWPFASPHWLASSFTVLALVLALHGTWRDRRGAAVGLGVVIGVAIMVQQQKGALVAIGTNVLALLLFAIPSGISVWTQLLCIDAGIAAIVVPAFGWLALQAGIAPIFYALVEHTFVNYRHHHQTGWGSVPLMTEGFAAYTFPRLLKYTPVILAPEALRVLYLFWTKHDPIALRLSLTLVVFGLSAAASIAYFPDFIHIGFIAGIFFIAAVSMLDRSLAALARGASWGRAVAIATALAAGVALALQLGRNLSLSQREFAITADTAFGRIAFSDAHQPDFVATADRLLADIPSREMFTYPFYASLYLMTSAHNPTPYQFLYPRYSGPDQVDEVIGILDARRVPLVFAFHGFVPKNDTLMAYIRAHYTPSDPNQIFWTRRPD
jgi:hypothetical protein